MDSSETNPYDPELPSSHSQYGAPRPLNLGRKIFLSHSGKDKNFVRFLHKELCQRYHDIRFVFFDEKDLPTAEPISMKNILIEARGCELGILVLSEDFFTHTANPMLELEALTVNEVRLLPLFYKVSVDEFNKMRHQSVWETQWKEWSVVDDGKILAWRHALNFVNGHSGLEYCKLATNELDFIYKVVNAVTRIVRPAISFSEEGICGRDRLCKIVDDMYIKCASIRSVDCYTQVASRFVNDGHRGESSDMLDLVGIYGFAGLGKTTLCRSLCDFYFAEFHGKVCWIDLGAIPSDQTSSQACSSSAFFIRMQHILFKLVGPIDGVDSLTCSQVQNLLRNQISLREDPVFLAIDNILPNQESQDEVHFYLSCKFSKGSKIFITARSEKILEYATSEFTKFSVVIEHIPKLMLKEAIDIFVHKSLNLQILGAEAEVEKCVRMCIIYEPFKRYDGLHDRFWYHPMMLKSLAVSLRYDKILKRDWKRKVRELQSGAIVDKTDALKTVFNMLDVTYKTLDEEEQKVFLDLTLFYRTFVKSWMYLQSPLGASYAWIQGVYSHLSTKRIEEILLLLNNLSFINLERNGHLSFRDQEHNGHSFFSVWKHIDIYMHELMVDFSKYKLLQGAAGFNPRCLLLENGPHLQNNPTFRFLLADVMSADKWPSCPPKNVRIVSISGGCRFEKGAHVNLDLRNLEGVHVLHLVYNPKLQEVLLSPTTIASVRSFIVKVLPNSTSSLRCILDEGWSTPSSSTANQGQLVWVELEGNVILDITRRKKSSWWSYLQSSDNSSSAASGFDLKLWPCFQNLWYLSLSQFHLTQSIGLTTITQLKNLRLECLQSLREIHGLERLTNLEELSITYCHKLVVLTIPANLKLSSEIKYCGSLQRVSLHHTMAYPEADCECGRLWITNCPALRSVDGIAQGMCCFTYFFPLSMGESPREGFLQEEIRELLGSSKFTATVTRLVLCRFSLWDLVVQDVQHAAFLVSALNMLKAKTTGRRDLGITCKKDGDCGCDKNVPHFGPWPWRDEFASFQYKCPQVRDLSSLAQLGHGLNSLDLRGCKNVDVWPDFTIMTSLAHLTLAHTSLKAFPDELLLLPSLCTLEIEGCWQLPVEQMITAITCKDLGYKCACGGCLGYNCACTYGSLYSLWDDLREKRRDSGSVVDVLDSQWPHFLTFFHKQRQYCNGQDRGIVRALRPLIYVMHELWFGELMAASYGGSDSERHPSLNMKNMKQLLCSKTFMSLVFNFEAKVNLKSMETCMVLALIGSASSGCITALLNEDLKDKIVNFVQYVLVESPQLPEDYRYYSNFYKTSYCPVHSFYLRKWVREAVHEMVRALSEAGELNVEVDHLTSTWFAEEEEEEEEDDDDEEEEVEDEDEDEGRLSC